MRILCVCLGNICRSPTAEAVLRAKLEAAGLGAIEVDSAGTGDWHVGSPPDERATAAAAARGIELGGTARQVRREDFERFDLLLAMDRSNEADLRALAPSPEAARRVRLIRELDPGAEAGLDVPDPYHGGSDGFDHVLDLLERACDGLLAELAGPGSR